ncbi:hypothetical protein [Lentibacillus sediminis]|uniref:hypothetical protein n=1 Tax=Lentibacillus sediminis TaxID=1940529 RepID=UPI001EFEB58D|nr:hypothetical protein [Lentibacillus sediminis]
MMKQILNELKEMRTDVDEIKQGQNRLEAGQEKLQKNLIENLGLYTDKIVDHFDNKTDALNKRVYEVETEIERLKKQYT